MKIKKFTFLSTYFSPFKPIKWKFYIGEVAIGTPYFFPRKWVKNKKGKGQIAVPKKIGFNFVGLGWKTKFDSIRHEWNPVWSFVFFKWQIAITFVVPHTTHYWECWLEYMFTDKTKSKRERIKIAREKNPCIWTSYKGDEEETICYWDLILKNKYIKLEGNKLRVKKLEQILKK